jgi:hypothetical protein
MFNPIRLPSFRHPYFNLGNIFNVRHDHFSVTFSMRQCAALTQVKKTRYAVVTKRDSGGIGEKSGAVRRLALFPADIRAGITAVKFLEGFPC